jgi:cytochrome P450
MAAAFDEAAAVISRESNQGQRPVDFQRLSTALTLNVIGRTALATDFDALGRSASPLTSAYKTLLGLFNNSLAAVVRSVAPAVSALPIRQFREERKAKALLHGQVESTIANVSRDSEAVVRSGLSRTDSLAHALVDRMTADVITEGRTVKDWKLTRIEVRDELLTLLLAGHETRCVNLSSFISQPSLCPCPLGASSLLFIYFV